MPDRRPLIAGNWKMWGTRAQAKPYCEKLLELIPAEGERPADVGLCVPFTALDLVVSLLDGSGVLVAAQDMHQDEAGAYTGHISAPMLTELGVDAVVLGHSERRAEAGETDSALQDKVPAALAAGLVPILCVGETEAEREEGSTQRKLRHQVQEDLERV
ncbi:MAG TPA: triose-phosphate isomerase, partial [Thermoleophilaceae bacterium]|nr:triose-phosphate isomerase [Thermoleophilaceae bacterium]